MASITKGILGEVSGKIGPVVGSNWKGITYIRSLPTKSNKPRTTAQLTQNIKFGLAVGFVNALKQLIGKSFAAYAVNKTEKNAAISYTMHHAVTGSYSNFTIDYALALVSRGDLPNAPNPLAVVAGNTIAFTWTDNSQIGTAKPTDHAILICYCAEMKRAVFTIGNTTRATGNGVLAIALFAGKQVHTWLAFCRADGSVYAESVYTGMVVV